MVANVLIIAKYGLLILVFTITASINHVFHSHTRCRVVPFWCSVFLYPVYIVFIICIYVFFFFFKQKTAYEIVSRDWSSDVCSSDLVKKRNLIPIDMLGKRKWYLVMINGNFYYHISGIDRKSVV